MKTKRIYTTTKNILFVVVVGILVLSLSSCATKAHFLTSSVVPAAEGTVKVKKDKNHNYVIDVNVVNLAEPGKLQPPKSTYVVWMEGDNIEAKNLGQMKSSSSMLSKLLKASFQSVSPNKPRKIFITAENDANMQFVNNSNVVLTTDYLKK